MAKKSDFIILYPDVAVQKIELVCRLPKKEIEKTLIEMTNSMGIGLLYYQSSGVQVEVFTSVQFGKFMNTMTEGVILVDLNGTTHKVVSEKPFICGGEFCIRTECEGREDVYSCTFFNPNR